MPSLKPRAEAAAAGAPPAAGIAVTRGTLVGVLACYGRHGVAALATPQAIGRCVAAGGRVIVTEGRKLDPFASLVPVGARFRARHGRRTLVVVTALPPRAQEPRS